MKQQLTEREVNLYSPLALAFLGDSVYKKGNSSFGKSSGIKIAFT